MSEQFTSPVGRIVQGDVWEPQLTDQQGKPRVFQGGPKAGQPSPQWFIALAFAKSDPAWPPFKALIDKVSATAWPQLFPNGPGSPCVLPTFSNKVIDGDGFDTTGKSNADKAGMAGHWVVRFGGGFAPKVWRETSPGSKSYVEVTDKSQVKRGYFARVAGTMEGNGQATKPGIYVNLGMLEIVAQGPEIISGPSAADAFGGAPIAALPPGATALGAPPANAAPLPGAAPAPPAAPYVPPAPPPPAPPAPPYAGYMQVPVMLPAAQGATYEAMKAAGWTDEAMVAGGMMAAPAAAAPPAPPAPPAAPLPPAAPPPPPAPPAGPTMTAKAAGQTREAMHGSGWTDALLIEHGYMIA